MLALGALNLFTLRKTPMSLFIKYLILMPLLFGLHTFGASSEELPSSDLLQKALKEAQQQNKDIKILFTGFEWCPHCQKFHNEILIKKEYQNYIQENFVLVIIDIPYNPMVDLSPEQYKEYRDLLTFFNVESFPTSALLTAKGELYYRNPGYASTTVGSYIQNLKTIKKLGRDIYTSYEQAQQLDSEKKYSEYIKILHTFFSSPYDIYFKTAPLILEVIELDSEEDNTATQIYKHYAQIQGHFARKEFHDVIQKTPSLLKNSVLKSLPVMQQELFYMMGDSYLFLQQKKKAYNAYKKVLDIQLPSRFVHLAQESIQTLEFLYPDITKD